MTPRLSTAVQELERAYARLNTTLFDAALPDNVVIAIQSRGRRSGVLGWYAPHSWRNGDDDGLHEITLTAETLARNDPADDLNVAETLIHEMAHHTRQLLLLRVQTLSTPTSRAATQAVSIHWCRPLRRWLLQPR